MTPEDRQAITAFFERLRTAETEVDAEADALIQQELARSPAARYHLTQMAFFQEQALAEAQNRIGQLESEASQRGSGGFLGGLFGGGRAVAPPPQVQAPGYRPGMFQQRGGFLGGAMQTAMGVAGGMMLGSFLASMLAPEAAAATPPQEEPMVEEPEMAADEEW